MGRLVAAVCAGVLAGQFAHLLGVPDAGLLRFNRADLLSALAAWAVYYGIGSARKAP